MADQQIGVFNTILAYSVFIILAPISTFFFTKLVIFEGILRTASISSNVWSAVAAIIVLHIALGMYIYKAYSDAGKSKPDKDDKVD